MLIMNAKGSVYDVQPLRKLSEIEDMKQSLRKWCSERDYFLFLIGINTGLRVSDILQLKVIDIKDTDHIYLREDKTKKKRNVSIKSIQADINAYIKGMDNDDWLFPSRKGDNPITEVQAYRSLVKAGEMVDLNHIGTHTMRKTFGYHYYKKHKDVAWLQEIFNHSAPSITKRYIGITQDEIDDSMHGFKL
jgi:integrase